MPAICRTNVAVIGRTAGEAGRKTVTISGAIGAALVDYDSGMTLGTAGGGEMDLEVAAAGNTDVVRAKMRTMQQLGLDDERELCLDVAKRTCDGTLSVNDGYEACEAAVETLSEADCETIRTALAEAMDVSMPASCIGLFNGI